MAWLNLLAIAIALAADAFAVALTAGLALTRLTRRHVFRLAFHFGLFQALMPTIGWSMGKAVHVLIAAIDHWLAFALLLLVGGRMVWNALHRSDEKSTAVDPTTGWPLVLLSVATSIDALAVGLSLAMMNTSILMPALVIGVVAALFTAAGMVLGRRVGLFWGPRVELIGGALLIGIGVKILMEHMRA